MNYSEMSDFEINVAVADKLSLYWHCSPSKNPEGKWLYSENYHLCDTKINAAVDLPDYCNSWADIGPIIELIFDSGITLIMNNGGVMTSNAGSKFNGESFDVEASPKRAAAIVFLMMKDAEQ